MSPRCCNAKNRTGQEGVVRLGQVLRRSTGHQGGRTKEEGEGAPPAAAPPPPPPPPPRLLVALSLYRWDKKKNLLCSCRQTTGGKGISKSRFILRPNASLSVPQRQATHEQAAPVTATCTHTLSNHYPLTDNNALQTALVVYC